MIQLSKGQTALLQSYINQTDTQVSRANFSAPYITDTNYNNLVDAIEAWVLESNTGELRGTNENSTTFTFSGIDQFPILKR
jgi:hypothetical protein